jgi:mannose-1-phosphate guanylyltransferase
MSGNPLDRAYCVIMAGGKGERFWPLSTDRMPKPFLRLMGEKTMIQLTVERALRIVPEERLFIVLGQNHLSVAKEQLPGLKDRNFLVEPEGRDTAPCIGFAALHLTALDEGAIMITLPADHYIPDVDAFVATILNGVACAGMGDYLVTVGISPVRPETGYGYINAFEPFEVPGVICYKVNRIVEKPDIEKARSYLEDGNYYWNAGIFIWRAAVVLEGIERFMPELCQGIASLKAVLGRKDPTAIAAIYSGLPRKSIDYGLMEKADNVLMIPSLFPWDDVGTWASLRRVLGSGGEGNSKTGNTICVDTKDCVVYGDGITVGTLGVSNLVIVATREGVLVCDSERAQEVKEIVKRLVNP